MDSAGNPIQNNNAIKFLKNLTGFSMATWVGFVISFISIPFTTRLFKPDQVGVINMFFYFSSLFAMLLSMGFDQAYVRFYFEPPNGKKPQQLLTLSLVLITIVTVVVAAVAIAFFPRALSEAIAGAYFPLIPWLLFINVLASIFLRFLNLTNRMKQNIIAFSLQSLLMVIMTKVFYLAAAFWNPKFQNAIELIVLGTSGLAVAYLIIQKRQHIFSTLVIDTKITKAILAFGIPLMPASVLVWLNGSISSLMLKQYLGLHAVGLYTSALGVASIIGLIQTGFNNYWASFVYSNYKTEQNKIRKIHSYLTLTMVAFGLVIIFSQDLIFTIIGKDYISSKQYFPFLLIYPICYTISETTGLGIGISKKSYLYIFPALANVCVNIAICLYALPRIGAVGAAIASAGAGLSMFIVKTIVGEKYYKCINNYTRTIAAILIIIIAAVANYLFFNNPIIKLSILAILFAILLIVYIKDTAYLFNIGVDILKRIIKRAKPIR